MFINVVSKLCRFKNPNCIVKRSFCGLVQPVYRIPLSSAQVFTVEKKYFHEKKINQRLEQSFKKSDKIPENYTLIYQASYQGYVKSSHIFATFSILSLPFSLLYSDVLWGPTEFPVYLAGKILFSSVVDYMIFSAGLLLFSLKLLLFVHLYPYRIYTDEKRYNYIAVFQHTVPFMYTNLHFTKSDISNAKTILPFKDLLFKFGKKNVILMESYFISPIEMNIMVNDIYKKD